MLMTYAVGVLSLRQSGTFLFIVCVFRATRGKRTQKIIKYHAAAGKSVAFGRGTTQVRNSYLYFIVSLYERHNEIREEGKVPL